MTPSVKRAFLEQISPHVLKINKFMRENAIIFVENYHFCDIL